MSESIRRLLTSKRSLIALVTLLADLALIFGLEVPAETQQLLVTVVTSLGGMLIAGRSVSDHGEAGARPALQETARRERSDATFVEALNSTSEPKPSDVETESGADA